jgi:hypothetical protein
MKYPPIIHTLKKKNFTHPPQEVLKLKLKLKTQTPAIHF